MHWILQENLWAEKQYDILVTLLKRMGISYSIHKVIPFVGELIPDIDPPNPVILFGSYSMRHLSKKRGWYPGVFDLKDVDFEVQREHWGEHMLNYDAQVTTFGNAVPPDGDFFIRPVNDTKYFNGQVMSADEFYDWRKKVIKLDNDTTDDLLIHSDTKIMIGKPKKIYQEFRHWVIKGNVVTSSMYKLGNKVCYRADVDKDVITYAWGMVHPFSTNSWQPHEAFVIDTCLTPDGPKIVEINTINSAGFYEADIQKLVEAFEENWK